MMGNVYDSADRTERTYARGGQSREDRRWRYRYDKQGNLVLKTKRKIRADFGHDTPQVKDKGIFGLFSCNNTSKATRKWGIGGSVNDRTSRCPTARAGTGVSKGCTADIIFIVLVFFISVQIYLKK